jgi:hypothetical protein
MNDTLARESSAANAQRSVRTTIFDLIRAFSEQTADDNLVVAAVSRLLSTGRVRSVRSLAPIAVLQREKQGPVRHRCVWSKNRGGTGMNRGRVTRRAQNLSALLSNVG